jgi:hypothetical protein
LLCCEVVNIYWPPPSSSVQIGEGMAQHKQQSMQGEDEVCACNRFYAAYVCSSLVMFRGSLLVPSSGVLECKMSYQHVLCNSAED